MLLGMPQLTDTHRLAALLTWRDTPPSAGIRGLPTVSVPLLGRLRKAIPQKLAQQALVAAYSSALKLSSPVRTLRRAGADDLDSLRERDLNDADQLAIRERREALIIASTTGAALGMAGVAGLVADAPALVVLSLRTVLRISACYGEPPSPALAASVFALASADTMAEKAAAWNAALAAKRTISGDASEPAVRDGLERAAEREFAKQALQSSLQKLGNSLVQRLGWKRVAGALPVVGAAVGGVVNAQFVASLAMATQQVCVARRLECEGHRLCLVIPEARPKRRTVTKTRIGK